MHPVTGRRRSIVRGNVMRIAMIAVRSVGIGGTSVAVVVGRIAVMANVAVAMGEVMAGGDAKTDIAAYSFKKNGAPKGA